MRKRLKSMAKRLLKRLGPSYPWTRGDEAYLDAVRRIGSDLLVRGLRGRGRLRSFLARKHRRNRNNWANATLAWGMISCNRRSSRSEEVAAIRKLFDDVIDGEGELRFPPALPDQCMIGYACLEMLDWTGDPRYGWAADSLVDFLLHRYPRNVNGTLPYAPDQMEVLLGDTLGMVCPLLTRHGVLSGNTEEIDLAVRQLEEYLERALDPVTGLSFHACHVVRPDRLGSCGWSRGTGWVLLGLTDTLAHLPAEHPGRAHLADAFARMVRDVSGYQRETGEWGWAMNIPGAHPDTSGTAFIGYSIERGVETGVLDRHWLSVSERAFDGIARLTTSKGRVSSSLSDAQGVGLYPYIFGHTVWAQGATAALGSRRVYRREVQ